MARFDSGGTQAAQKALAKLEERKGLRSEVVVDAMRLAIFGDAKA